MDHLKHAAGWMRCLVRGHSRKTTFSYGYALDAPVIVRCLRCYRVLPSSTVRGVTTLKPCRMEKQR
jgi:hypothetical protein